MKLEIGKYYRAVNGDIVFIQEDGLSHLGGPAYGVGSNGIYYRIADEGKSNIHDVGGEKFELVEELDIE